MQQATAEDTLDFVTDFQEKQEAQFLATSDVDTLKYSISNISED